MPRRNAGKKECWCETQGDNEQRPKEGEGAGHANPWEKVAPDKSN